MIISPLYVEMWVRKIKKFYINLNRVKTLHFIQYNNMKKKYKEVMKEQIEKLKPLEWAVEIIITYYNWTRRKSDLDNCCVVQSKFFQDALVELWKIKEDNYEYIKKITYIYWWYDKWNGRCEIDVLNY